MSTSPLPLLPWEGGDRIDLDELFRDARPIGDGADLAAPEVFETDQELDEFLSFLHAGRHLDIS